MIIDITVPIRSGMIVFEGDPAVRLERVVAMEDGAVCDISHLDFGVHTGTHIDAPSHFIQGAPSVESWPLDALVGPVRVVDVTALAPRIRRADLEDRGFEPGERVIFKTRNSDLWARDAFAADFVALALDAAEYLVEVGVRLAGIDYLSIAPFGDPTPTHVALLEAGVVILEGLDLRNVEAGHYELICLPLRLDGAEGAPARAVLVRG